MGYSYFRNDFTALANYTYADLGIHYVFFQKGRNTLKATASIGKYWLMNAGFYHTQIRSSSLYGEETAIHNFIVEEEDLNRDIKTIIPKAGML